MKKKNDFEFNYVAPTGAERKEIERIRNSYLIKEKPKGKLEQLRKLDAKVKNIPSIISLVLGIIGILIFGLGFTMVLEWQLYFWGVIVSFVGLVPTLLAYPIYLLILKRLKNKYSAEILELSEQLLDDNN